MKALSIFISLIFLYIIASQSVNAEAITGNSKGCGQLSTVAVKDTFMVSGLTFGIIEYKSARSLKASIKNNQIQIVNQGVQYFQYRIIYYVFSSLDDGNMPVIRHFDQRLSFPVLNALKNAALGGRYIFEEIIVVDPSGIKLSNEVRSIIIERIE